MGLNNYFIKAVIVTVMHNTSIYFLQIRDNIEQIFAKFINEGKATIRLKDPPQDLCLCKVGKVTLTCIHIFLRISCAMFIVLLSGYWNDSERHFWDSGDVCRKGV